MAGYAGSKEDYLKRLRRIEGQVRGLQRMVDEDTYCIDVLTQVAAVTKALQAVSLGLLEDHVSHCVVDAAARTSDADAQAKLRRGRGRHRPPRQELNHLLLIHRNRNHREETDHDQHDHHDSSCQRHDLGHCVQAVTSGFTQVKGVHDVAVQLVPARIHDRPSPANSRWTTQLRAAIDEAGMPSPAEHTDNPVSAPPRRRPDPAPPRSARAGHDVVPCAARIEKKLNRMDGVSAFVNYPTSTAHVPYP